MRYGWLVLCLIVTACTAKIATVDQALDEVEKLDHKYNTSYRAEQFHTVILNEEEMGMYIEELEGLRERAKPETEQQGRWIKWLLDAREQMLLSQITFQRAWVGIGERGRVSDGYRCSELPEIRKATVMMENAWVLADNSTRVLDSLMTESTKLRERIGIGDDRPAMYDSDFERLYNEVRSNVIAMHQDCKAIIQTSTFNFTDDLEKINKSEG